MVFPQLKLFLRHLLLWPHSLSHLRWFQRWKEEGWRPVFPYYDIRCCIFLINQICQLVFSSCSSLLYTWWLELLQAVKDGSLADLLLCRVWALASPSHPLPSCRLSMLMTSCLAWWVSSTMEPMQDPHLLYPWRLAVCEILVQRHPLPFAFLFSPGINKSLFHSSVILTGFGAPIFLLQRLPF